MGPQRPRQVGSSARLKEQMKSPADGPTWPGLWGSASPCSSITHPGEVLLPPRQGDTSSFLAGGSSRTAYSLIPCKVHGGGRVEGGGGAAGAWNLPLLQPGMKSELCIQKNMTFPLPVGTLPIGRAECCENTRRNSYIMKDMGSILPWLDRAALQRAELQAAAAQHPPGSGLGQVHSVLLLRGGGRRRAAKCFYPSWEMLSVFSLGKLEPSSHLWA